MWALEPGLRPEGLLLATQGPNGGPVYAEPLWWHRASPLDKEAAAALCRDAAVRWLARVNGGTVGVVDDSPGDNAIVTIRWWEGSDHPGEGSCPRYQQELPGVYKDADGFMMRDFCHPTLDAALFSACKAVIEANAHA